MRGRPAKSKMRKRIAAILQHVNASYGYEIYKSYKQVFGHAKMRTIYYNLRQGVLLNEFLISDIKREIGNYTWGSETERVYYSNGPLAEPIILDEMQKIKLEKIEPKKFELNVEAQTRRVLEEIKDEVADYALTFKNHTVKSRTKKYDALKNKINKTSKWAKQTGNQELIKEFEELSAQLKKYKY
jgi:hypothetical protein